MRKGLYSKLKRLAYYTLKSGVIVDGGDWIAVDENGDVLATPAEMESLQSIPIPPGVFSLELELRAGALSTTTHSSHNENRPLLRRSSSAGNLDLPKSNFVISTPTAITMHERPCHSVSPPGYAVAFHTSDATQSVLPTPDAVNIGGHNIPQSCIDIPGAVATTRIPSPRQQPRSMFVVRSAEDQMQVDRFGIGL